VKIVLYSGYDDDNLFLDHELIRMSGKLRPKITFIPSSHYAPEDEYIYFCNTFLEYGISQIDILNIDQPYSQGQLHHALKSDIIFLGGGNTFYFLKSILNHGFDQHLTRFLKHGGVVSGLSAGAIVLTPSIATAGYPKFDRDDNTVQLKNLSALNFVPFDFFPHYGHEPEYVSELIKQSKKQKNRPIYAVADGGGIIIKKHTTTFYGDIWCYLGGSFSQISTLK
jgi:dipeptidase E